jgi:hypothetical protein
MAQLFWFNRLPIAKPADRLLFSLYHRCHV